jgi:hypothetical protein
MGVIVSSSIQQNHNVISGDIKMIVVVRTNPGYGPNPNQSGTGTIVAVICVSGSSAKLEFNRDNLQSIGDFWAVNQRRPETGLLASLLN